MRLGIGHCLITLLPIVVVGALIEAHASMSVSHPDCIVITILLIRHLVLATVVDFGMICSSMRGTARLHKYLDCYQLYVQLVSLQTT
ncbi:hypothetical protein BGX38DRAFT_1226879 [Terfezia claveryi]|nr:hypothetical protein BGX38DRAFT_1226879 [Terfezia claveryi]